MRILETLASEHLRYETHLIKILLQFQDGSFRIWYYRFIPRFIRYIVSDKGIFHIDCLTVYTFELVTFDLIRAALTKSHHAIKVDTFCHR